MEVWGLLKVKYIEEVNLGEYMVVFKLIYYKGKIEGISLKCFNIF